MVSYEELTTKILSNCGKEKIVHLGDKIFIDEHIQKLEKLIIVRKEKARRKSWKTILTHLTHSLMLTIQPQKKNTIYLKEMNL